MNLMIKILIKQSFLILLSRLTFSVFIHFCKSKFIKDHDALYHFHKNFKILIYIGKWILGLASLCANVPRESIGTQKHAMLSSSFQEKMPK